MLSSAVRASRSGFAVSESFASFGARVSCARPTPTLTRGGTSERNADTPLAAESRSVQQGFLEDSNVNTVGSMVDMISIQRSYAAVQRTMTTLDGIRQTISNELGKV